MGRSSRRSRVNINAVERGREDRSAAVREDANDRRERLEGDDFQVHRSTPIRIRTPPEPLLNIQHGGPRREVGQDVRSDHSPLGKRMGRVHSLLDYDIEMRRGGLLDQAIEPLNAQHPVTASDSHPRALPGQAGSIEVLIYPVTRSPDPTRGTSPTEARSQRISPSPSPTASRDLPKMKTAGNNATETVPGKPDDCFVSCSRSSQSP